MSYTLRCVCVFGCVCVPRVYVNIISADRKVVDRG